MQPYADGRWMRGVVRENISAPFLCYHVPEKHRQISQHSVGRFACFSNGCSTFCGRGSVVGLKEAPQRVARHLPGDCWEARMRKGDQEDIRKKKKKKKECGLWGGGPADIDDLPLLSCPGPRPGATGCCTGTGVSGGHQSGGTSSEMLPPYRRMSRQADPVWRKRSQNLHTDAPCWEISIWIICHFPASNL